MPSTIHHLMKEPLLHFILAGGLLFLGSLWLGNDEAVPTNVQVSNADIRRLSTLWTRQWNRSPSAEEQQALITDHIKEILLAREAIALGLDQNDTVIQRRLAQKMRFLLEDTVRTTVPDEQVLREYYRQHSAQFQAPAQRAFTQFRFATAAAAEQALTQLQTNPTAEVGEPSTLESDFPLLDQVQTSQLFGPDFAAQLFTLQPQQWQGPLASGYGYHLVRINHEQAARSLPFEDVQARVREQWTQAEQTRAEQQYFAALLKKYDIDLDDSLRALLQQDWLTQVSP